MERSTLRCTTGGHYKEYTIVLDGTTVRLYWGKIGATQQNQTKTFTTERAARSFAKQKEWEKIQKDYVMYDYDDGKRYISPLFREDIELMIAAEKA